MCLPTVDRIYISGSQILTEQGRPNTRFRQYVLTLAQPESWALPLPKEEPLHYQWAHKEVEKNPSNARLYRASWKQGYDPV